ncbi:MAG TPA: FmdB family zinc ribbon protein [Rhodothermia bacterium]|nr:FmdB family zinc ribbon protein [Rhodothermia bacterium]
MPLYEFRCPQGHDFERFYRSINVAAAEEPCPVCGEIATRRLSAAGLVFKGSGFYITDYGKDGKKAEREAISAEKTKAEAAEVGPKADAKASDSGAAAPESKSTEKTKPSPPTESSTSPGTSSAEKSKPAAKAKSGE